MVLNVAKWFWPQNNQTSTQEDNQKHAKAHLLRLRHHDLFILQNLFPARDYVPSFLDRFLLPNIAKSF